MDPVRVWLSAWEVVCTSSSQVSWVPGSSDGLHIDTAAAGGRGKAACVIHCLAIPEMGSSHHKQGLLIMRIWAYKVGSRQTEFKMSYIVKSLHNSGPRALVQTRIATRPMMACVLPPQ